MTSEGDGASRSTTINVDVNAADPEDVIGDVNDVGTSDPSTPEEPSALPLPTSLLLVAVLLAVLRRPKPMEKA